MIAVTKFHSFMNTVLQLVLGLHTKQLVNISAQVHSPPRPTYKLDFALLKFDCGQEYLTGGTMNMPIYHMGSH